jgi:hypothetical protein
MEVNDERNHLVDHVVRCMERADREPYREGTILADAWDHVEGCVESHAEAARIWSAACAAYDENNREKS